MYLLYLYHGLRLLSSLIENQMIDHGLFLYMFCHAKWVTIYNCVCVCVCVCGVCDLCKFRLRKIATVFLRNTHSKKKKQKKVTVFLNLEYLLEHIYFLKYNLRIFDDIFCIYIYNLCHTNLTYQVNMHYLSHYPRLIRRHSQEMLSVLCQKNIVFMSSKFTHPRCFFV